MLDLIDIWCFRGILMYFTLICAEIRLEGSMWQRGLLNLINFEGWMHRDCLILWSFDVFHYDLRGDSLWMGLCGIAGCLICLISRDGYIGIACFY